MKELFQRKPEAMLSSAAEASNLAETNALLDTLFSNREVLATRAFRQLNSLFGTREHYGRNVRLGMSANEAGKALKRSGCD
jgi:hypothetical protein